MTNLRNDMMIIEVLWKFFSQNTPKYTKKVASNLIERHLRINTDETILYSGIDIGFLCTC